MPGKVISIFLAHKNADPTSSVNTVQVLDGVGLDGDRHQDGTVTLIEQEALEAAQRDYNLTLAPGESRRNLLVEGAPLNHWVGKRFRVGKALLEGHELCEPCGHLEKLTQPGVRKALIHRGGLRARVIAGGSVNVGDSLVLEGG